MHVERLGHLEEILPFEVSGVNHEHDVEEVLTHMTQHPGKRRAQEVLPGREKSIQFKFYPKVFCYAE